MGSVNPKTLISREPLRRCRSPSAKEKAPFGLVCVCVCVLFGEQSSGGCQRGMIYKVETSLKCAGVCGRDPGVEGERRKPRTRAGWRHSLGWRGPGGAGTARRAVIR